MSAKVLKVLLVVDSEDATEIMAFADLSPKERESRPESFVFIDEDGRTVKTHFVFAEVV